MYMWQKTYNKVSFVVRTFSASFVLTLVSVGGQRSVQFPCGWGLRGENVLVRLA